MCGGDESECATGRSARTAHAVGDPHYLTFDGTSFDYQIAGEFILARHMNDIEMQNEQMRCPNPNVRCNIATAVITRNWNIQFRGEWKVGEKIMVNGEMWSVNKEYKYGQLVVLDVDKEEWRERLRAVDSVESLKAFLTECGDNALAATIASKIEDM